MHETVEIRPYDSSFKEYFLEEKFALGLEIEHVGSTSVPGLGGKHVLDLLLIARSKEDALEKVRVLEKRGYEINQDAGDPERIFMHADKMLLGKSLHIHMHIMWTQKYREMLLFRDHMIAHPEDAKEYFALKKDIAAKVNYDREEYTKIKAAYVKEIIEKATLPLYFAPINLVGNKYYRHFLFEKGADFVFSELMLCEHMDQNRGKLDIFEEDLERTIIQIGAGTKKEIDTLIPLLPNVNEVNLNMGCPQSSMKEICGGLLSNKEKMKKVASCFYEACRGKVTPSVKIRLGPSQKKIEISEYLTIFRDIGIKKVYIHARTLGYNYTRPAMIECFEGLKQKFMDMTLIYNGDVCTYNDYARFFEMGCDGVMIGRAALRNPLLFRDIKAHKDTPDILCVNGRHIMSKEKERAITEFKELCKRYKAPEEVMNRNIKWMQKGVSS